MVALQATLQNDRFLVAFAEKRSLHNDPAGENPGGRRGGCEERCRTESDLAALLAQGVVLDHRVFVHEVVCRVGSAVPGHDTRSLLEKCKRNGDLRVRQPRGCDQVFERYAFRARLFDRPRDFVVRVVRTAVNVGLAARWCDGADEVIILDLECLDAFGSRRHCLRSFRQLKPAAIDLLEARVFALVQNLAQDRGVERGVRRLAVRAPELAVEHGFDHLLAAHRFLRVAQDFDGRVENAGARRLRGSLLRCCLLPRALLLRPALRAGRVRRALAGRCLLLAGGLLRGFLACGHVGPPLKRGERKTRRRSAGSESSEFDLALTRGTLESGRFRPPRVVGGEQRLADLPDGYIVEIQFVAVALFEGFDADRSGDLFDCLFAGHVRSSVGRRDAGEEFGAGDLDDVERVGELIFDLFDLVASARQAVAKPFDVAAVSTRAVTFEPIGGRDILQFLERLAVAAVRFDQRLLFLPEREEDALVAVLEVSPDVEFDEFAFAGGRVHGVMSFQTSGGSVGEIFDEVEVLADVAAASAYFVESCLNLLGESPLVVAVGRISRSVEVLFRRGDVGLDRGSWLADDDRNVLVRLAVDLDLSDSHGGAPYGVRSGCDTHMSTSTGGHIKAGSAVFPEIYGELSP